MITTHESTVEQFQKKALDVDGYVEFLVGYRDYALSLENHSKASAAE